MTLTAMVAVSTELYKALAGAPSTFCPTRVFWQGFACFTSPHPKNRQGVWDESLGAKEASFSEAVGQMAKASREGARRVRVRLNG